jgi:hypothetical protein
VYCGGSRSLQELASGDAVAIGGVTAGGIRSSIAATITIRIRCVVVLYSVFFLFFYAYSFPCCDSQTIDCHGSFAVVRVEDERELLLPFPKLSKLWVSSPRSSEALPAFLLLLQAQYRYLKLAGQGKGSYFCWCFFCDNQVQLHEVEVCRTQ